MSNDNVSTHETPSRHYAVGSLFPEMFDAFSRLGVGGRGLQSGAAQFRCFNPRDFTLDKHQTVDDRPYGGGPGMVMRVEPLKKAVLAAIAWMDVDREHVKVVYMSPQGRQLDTPSVDQFKAYQHVVFVAGRYEGVDERFIEQYVDEEWSIGDYVLSGGELPVMVMLDAVIRRLPGVLGHSESVEEDSFESGLLDCPHYTRPEEFEGNTVPPVLLSGDHKKIRAWRYEQALQRTQQRRPDLIKKRDQ